MKQNAIPSIEILGKALKTARRNKGLTQIELAELTGLKQKTISGAENGSPGIRIDTLFRIISGLDLNIMLEKRKNSKSNQGEW